MADRNQDVLNVLGVFHIIFGAVAALLGLMPVLMVAMGVAIIHDPQAAPAGIFLAVLAGFLILLLELFAIFLIAVGRCLMRQRCYVFCIVMAILLCLIFPVGTILGVPTLIVLLQDNVREMFG